ncbi:MAG: ATP-dependent sacrificial sulfur transferase LarE [Ignavibacteriales bacterium]|nr:ATP-dependent sacrificial sulfur transferase LarE [Ignavibacteriales bacterium]
MLSDTITEKYSNLQETLRLLGSVAIGYSGGIDSTLVLRVACDVLGANALAVIGRSATYPTREFEEALATAQKFGARIRVVDTEETDNLKFQQNPPNRCYFCKSELFGKLHAIAAEEGIAHIADGTITDDLVDFRPGMAAKREQNVRSPLLETNFSKADVRELAKHLGVPFWDKPSFACLASRFPYWTGITKENLMKIDSAETFFRDHGFRQFRVRHHDDTTVRIELSQQEFPQLFDAAFRSKCVAHLKSLGYTYITVDLQGYRTGSMNETLTADVKMEFQQTL